MRKIKTNKKLGQHFLIDQHIIDHIIKYFRPKKCQNIIEIGPGLGALTLPLLRYMNHIYAIEFDYHLIKYLQKKYEKIRKKVTFVSKDVMTVNFLKFYNEKNKNIRILGNLPYNISTSLILHLSSHIDIINDMLFMLQKEVVNRLISVPNSKTYGSLSIITQYFFNILPILEVNPISFQPTPKVDSVLTHFIPYKNNPYQVNNIQLFKKIIKTAFNQRRKKISNSLNIFFSKKDFKKLKISSYFRAENLSIKDYCNLACLLHLKHANKK
ncbi:MAG: 16S rRNA (adenine(1518)-N(6)/adenine(1519)-N(6))-dimethyltransferase RsmA [Arsenophonus sp.]|nr:MAG: 16S rRNA (adenine(1518)-N(6)/adenine(1519)-N(6))-dimethyltransferase RsmA [Arsenophonus sp.]